MSDQMSATATAARTPVLEARNVSKYFGSVVALEDVSLRVHTGEIVCLLGDNGAGKSTLIKILCGLFQPDSGEVLVDGSPVNLGSPRDALRLGIATVYQDLAVLPLMSISRNFVVGAEPTMGWGPFRRLDMTKADADVRRALEGIGIDVRDTSQEVGTLSGGERQALAIARAEHLGARVLILDEPTSALGVKEAAIVLRHMVRARARGRAIILITHNPQHALPVGDSFVVLNRGRAIGPFAKGELSQEGLMQLMAGGEEFTELEAELAAIEHAERELLAAQAAAAAAGVPIQAINDTIDPGAP